MRGINVDVVACGGPSRAELDKLCGVKRTVLNGDNTIELDWHNNTLAHGYLKYARISFPKDLFRVYSCIRLIFILVHWLRPLGSHRVSAS